MEVISSNLSGAMVPVWQASSYIITSTVAPVPIQPMLNIPAMILLPLIIIFTFVGNILTITTVLSWHQLRDSIACWFLVSLALSDLFLSLLVLPFNAAELMIGRWPFGNFCKYFIAFDIMISTVSILNLSMIAFDRYLAIAHPFRYQVWMTRQRCIIAILSAWILSALLAFVPFARQDVFFSVDVCELDLTPIYAIVSSFISFFIPSIVMVIAYYRIYVVAREHFQRMQANVNSRLPGYRRRHKAAITLGIVTGVFILLWTPFFLVNCIRSFHPDLISNELFLTVTWLGWINSGVNPVIYSTNTEIRAGMKRVLCKGRVGSHNVESTSPVNNWNNRNTDVYDSES